jgi:hypothetical protein
MILCERIAKAWGTLNFCRALLSWTFDVFVVFSGRSDEDALGDCVIGMCVNVISKARNGLLSGSVFMFGFGVSCSPISAGRKVGKDGMMFGGSSCTSVGAVVRLARGASLVSIWKHVSRKNRLWIGVFDIAVQEKK